MNPEKSILNGGKSLANGQTEFSVIYAKFDLHEGDEMVAHATGYVGVYPVSL